MIAYPAWLTKETAFVLGSLLIALSIVVQMLNLYRHKGKISGVPALVQLLSFVDGVWFFVCAAALYFLNLNPIVKSVAVIFMSYMVLSFLYAGMTMENKLPERTEDIVFAKRYMDFNIAFSVAFAALCVLTMWLSLQQIELSQLL